MIDRMRRATVLAVLAATITVATITAAGTTAAAVTSSPTRARSTAGPSPDPVPDPDPTSSATAPADQHADAPPVTLDWAGTLVGAPVDGQPMPRFRAVTNSDLTSDTERNQRSKIIELVNRANDAAAKYDAAVAEVGQRTQEMVTARADLSAARNDVSRAEQEAREFAAAVVKGRYNGQINKVLESMYAGDPALVAHNIEMARAADAWKGDAIAHRDTARAKEVTATAAVRQAVEARQRAVDVLGGALAQVRSILDEAVAYLNATPGVGSLAAVFPDPAAASTVSTGAVGPLTETRTLTAIVLDPRPDVAAVLQATYPASVPATLSTVTISRTKLVVAGVDPTAARTLAPADAGTLDALWHSVARGELVVAHAVAGRTHLDLGKTVTAEPVFYGPKVTGPIGVTVGGYATLGWPGIDAVTSPATGDRLGSNHTMLLVSTDADPAQTLIHIRSVADGAEVVPVAGMSPAATAYLPETETRQWFSPGVTWHTGPGDTVVVDPGWEHDNITEETYPIVGTLRCNRLITAQLSGALTELAARGLQNLIQPAATCYTPQQHNQQLTAAGWGISVHLQPNPDPQGVATVVEPDVAVVLRRWGFQQTTDTPDHATFVLAALLRQS